MAYSKKTQQKARNLYVHSHYNLSVISITLDVSNGTLARWKSNAQIGGDDWDIARSADMMSGEGFDKAVSKVIEDFMVMFQTAMDDIPNEKDLKASEKVKILASLSDAFTKMISSAGKVAPNLSKLGIATQILKLQAEFIQQKFPQHATAFLEILEPFGIEVAKEYSE